MALLHSTQTLPPVEDGLHTMQVTGGALVPDHFVPAWEVDEAQTHHRLFTDYQGRLYVLRPMVWLEAANVAMRIVDRQRPA
jgi:hypothetical protein